jgi:hypothetical protein
MKNLKSCEKYVSPECTQLNLMLEGAVLVSSGADSLGVFEDNDIIYEEF